MTEIIWHGRGGQGAFTAAKLLGAAFILADENHFALAFPSFGPERRGAPIRAFTKLCGGSVGNRSEVEQADYSIFLDETLFTETAYEELKPDGRILLNTKQEVKDPKVTALDGDGLAREILGLPITNTVMLGAFTALFPDISLEDAEAAVRQYMPERLWTKNIAAMEKAAETVRKGAIS